MNEIDLIIDDGGVLYPVEIRKHSDPQKRDIRSFSILDKISGVKRGQGGVVCTYDNLVSLSPNDRAIPVNYL